MFRQGLACWTLGIALLGPGCAGAAEIVIDPVHPAAAVARAAAGDVLIIDEGIHRDLKIEINATGEAERPITLRGRTPGRVILTGQSAITVSGRHVVVSGLVFDQAWRGSPVVTFTAATDCRLTDCAFIECGNPASTFTHIVEMNRSSKNNRADHCFMMGNISMGMAVRVNAETDADNTGNRFDHNYFKDITPRSSNGQESVQLGQGPAGETSVRAVVEFNLFERASGDPEIISNKSSDNLIRFNTFRDCDRSELVLRGGKRATVEGNFIINCKGGIRVHDQGHRIFNNYIEGCGRGIWLSHTHPGYEAASHCVLAFNTVVNCKKQALSLGRIGGEEDKANAPQGNLIANNLFASDAGTLIEDASQQTQWKANLLWAGGKAKPGAEGAGRISADPKLARDQAILRPTAAVKDQAVALSELTVKDDLDGQPRDSAADIGCDEQSDAPVTRRPLTPQEVGPTWMNGDPSKVGRIKDRREIPKPTKK